LLQRTPHERQRATLTRMERHYLGSPASDPLYSSVTHDDWRLLRLLNLFRTGVAAAFCLLYLFNKLLPPLGSTNPLLFFAASLLYLFLSLLLWFSLSRRKIQFSSQVYASAIVDALLVTALMHSSGGIESGLGVLLVVTIAAATIVVSQRTALGLAAFATIMILLQQFYAGLDSHKQSSYPIAGFLGVTYFATAILVYALAKRIRESEALAQKRGIDLANLAQLTEHIIQRMQTGVLVVDQQGIVRLINEAAAQMLSINPNTKELSLGYLSAALAAQWHHWQTTADFNPAAIHLAQFHIDIMPRFAKISDTAEGGALIFLQDMAALAQQAQQLQLASLGRLTASIAHEIRNPLGAISHAGQLLAESEQIDKNDKRLTKIILDHSQRINTIVENVMSVSRRRPSNVELVALQPFLQRFVSEYSSGQNVEKNVFAIEVEPADLHVRFDASHLQQILVNLCDNALRHCDRTQHLPLVILRAGYIKQATRPHLDVIDNGAGVAPEALAHLFEPFFTTNVQGSGLGLYLSRELAEANQAHLNYISSDQPQSVFRLTFQDPRRQFE